MDKNNINFFITPVVAATLVKLYYNLKTNPDTDPKDIQDLELRLQEISEFNNWDFKEVQQIVDRLAYIAATDETQAQTAAVPPNLEELVKTYVAYEEKLSKPKTSQVQIEIENARRRLEKERALIARLSPGQILEPKKTSVVAGQIYEKAKVEENIVPEIPESRFTGYKTPPRESEAKDESGEQIEPYKERVGEWVEQARTAVRIQKMADALAKANVPKKYTLPIAEKIAQTNQGGQTSVIDEIKFAQVVSEAIAEQDAKDATQLTPQSNEVVTEIINRGKVELPEINSALKSTPEIDTQNAPFDLSQQLTRPQNRPRFVTPPAPEEAGSEEENRQTRRASQDITNTTLLLYYQPPQYKRMFSSLGNLGGFNVFYSNDREATKQLLLKAFTQIQVQDPKFYSKNQLYIEIIKRNIDEILPLGTTLESAQFITPEIAAKRFEEIKASTGAALLQLTLDPKTDGVETTQLSPRELTEHISRLAQLSELSASKTIEGIRSDLESKGKDLASDLAIKYSRFTTNSFTGGGQSFFSSIIPKPLQFLTRGISEGFGAPSLKSGAGRLLNLASMGKKLGPLIARGLAALAGVASSEVLVPIGVILVVVVGVVVFLGIMQGDMQHGMFLTQKTSFGVPTESQYISLNKTASPIQYTGELPTDIQFTITIAAKEKNLKDITVTDSFSVFSKTSPPAPTLPSDVKFPTSLEIGKSETVTFKINLGPQYKDSVVTNTVTVKANVQDGPNGETLTRSVPITIGVPPTGCFVLDGSWADSNKSKALASFTMLSRFPAYMNYVCKDSKFGPNIIVRYGGPKNYGGEVNGGNIMTLYDTAFDSRGSACTFYTIAHESGHVLANKNPEILADFLKNVDPGYEIPPHKEAYIPSYTLGFEPSEDFAESIAMYIKNIIGDYDCAGNYSIGVKNMSSVSPIHYNFWTKYIK